VRARLGGCRRSFDVGVARRGDELVGGDHGAVGLVVLGRVGAALIATGVDEGGHPEQQRLLLLRRRGAGAC
jgi:hypothetical protein